MNHNRSPIATDSVATEPIARIEERTIGCDACYGHGHVYRHYAATPLPLTLVVCKKCRGVGTVRIITLYDPERR